MNKYLVKIFPFVFIHIIWYLLSYYVGVNLIPRPDMVWMRLFILLTNGTIFLHAGFSLLRITIAIGFALVIGVPLGVMAGANRKMDKWFSPIVYLLYPIPKIAFLPVFIVLFGLGDLSKIMLLFTVLVFQLVLAARDGMKQIPIEYHRVVNVLKLSKKDKLLKLYLPSVLPSLFNSLRIGIGISLAVLFFCENYATTYGIGYYIMSNWMMVNYVGMFAGILALSLLAAGLITCVDLLEKKYCKWLIYEKKHIV